MKKLLVLISIVSLLAFAGSAFGATTWTAPTTEQAIADMVGHLETLGYTDTVGHYSNGETAWAWYLGQKAKSLATTKDGTTSKLMENAGFTVLDSTNLTVSDASTSAQTSLTTNSAFSSWGSVVKFMDLPKFTISSTAVAAGKEVAIRILASSDVTSSVVNKLVGTSSSPIYIRLFADSSNTSSNVATMWLKAVSSSAVKSNMANNAAASASQVAAGDTIYLCFTYGPGTYSPVQGAASSATVLDGAALTSTAVPTSLLGSSGGGCALGTSALALAVLGLFIAKRRG